MSQSEWPLTVSPPVSAACGLEEGGASGACHMTMLLLNVRSALLWPSCALAVTIVCYSCLCCGPVCYSCLCCGQALWRATNRLGHIQGFVTCLLRLTSITAECCFMLW